nr:hypothetical protein [uncultured Oscillibacter sp.]
MRADEEKPYTVDEIGKILDSVKNDPMIYCWVFLMAELGCRPSEVSALQFDDINFEIGTIHICKTLGKEADFDPVTHKRVSKFRHAIKDLKNDNGEKVVKVFRYGL